VLCPIPVLFRCCLCDGARRIKAATTVVGPFDEVGIVDRCLTRLKHHCNIALFSGSLSIPGLPLGDAVLSKYDLLHSPPSGAPNMAITMALLVKFELKYGVDQDWGGDAGSGHRTVMRT
jgi:hypothetical protein